MCDSHGNPSALIGSSFLRLCAIIVFALNACLCIYFPFLFSGKKRQSLREDDRLENTDAHPDMEPDTPDCQYRWDEASHSCVIKYVNAQTFSLREKKTMK